MRDQRLFLQQTPSMIVHLPIIQHSVDSKLIDLTTGIQAAHILRGFRSGEGSASA